MLKTSIERPVLEKSRVPLEAFERGERLKEAFNKLSISLLEIEDITETSLGNGYIDSAKSENFIMGYPSCKIGFGAYMSRGKDIRNGFRTDFRGEFTEDPFFIQTYSLNLQSGREQRNIIVQGLSPVWLIDSDRYGERWYGEHYSFSPSEVDLAVFDQTFKISDYTELGGFVLRLKQPT